MAAVEPVAVLTQIPLDQQLKLKTEAPRADDPCAEMRSCSYCPDCLDLGENGIQPLDWDGQQERR